MAIEIHDAFSEVMGTAVQSTRLESFVWISLAQEAEFMCARDWMPEHFRSMAAALLLVNPTFVQRIRQNLQKQIPANYLRWINGCDRQWVWMAKYVTGSALQVRSSPYVSEMQSLWLSEDFAHKVPHHLLGSNRSIACFDYWASRSSFGLDGAIDRSTKMCGAWEGHTQWDSIFAWLDGADGEKKRAYFWKWLVANKHPLTDWRPQFESHEELLIYFDEYTIAVPERELVSMKARKAWSQHQRRESSKGKQQCNFVLSDQTIKKLKVLAQKYGLTRTEIVELLIDSEAKNESYILERLRRRALLTDPV